MSDDRDILRFTDRHEWRGWLQVNHRICSEAWLVIYKKHAADKGLSLNEAIEEALCYGWIDGTLKPIDDETYSLRFTLRKKNSLWAISNIRRVERLTESDLMTEAGLAAVREAQQNGQWEQALKREQTQEIPEDLRNALRRRKGALRGYRELSASRKKQLLYWIDSAKKPKTRARRIQAIVDEAAS